MVACTDTTLGAMRDPTVKPAMRNVAQMPGYCGLHTKPNNTKQNKDWLYK